MPAQFFLDRRPHNGITYEEYLERFRAKIAAMEKAEQSNEKAEQSNGKDNSDYEKLNLQRSSRIDKTYSIDPELCELMSRIKTPQLWMVLTEDWCGDSAQKLPYIAKIAKCNKLIDLRILYRDENTDIMDLYLTDGKSRSIPKLVAFDMEGNEIFQWGPRPKVAQEFVAKAKMEGKPKEQYIEELHLWYAKDRGKTLETEFKELLTKMISTTEN